MIPKLLAKKNLLWKLVFPWVDLALLLPMENILWDDVVFKLRKTRQKLALSLTPLGAVGAAAEHAEGTGYKNRRLGKPRGVRIDSKLVYGAIRSEPETAAQSSFLLLALLSVSGNTRAVSTCIVVGAVTVTPAEFVSPLSESSPPRKH